MPDHCAILPKRFLPPDAAGDEDEVASTSSSNPDLGHSSTTKPGADTGAAQAVKELKADPSRNGVPAQHEQPASDAGDAMPLQVTSITDHFWLDSQQ